MTNVPAPLVLLRVCVVGTSCAGKTTFARQLAAALDSPYIEIDALHWKADWQGRPPEEFRALVQEAAAQRRWGIDGNYGSVRDLIWSRASAVIWLDYPFRLAFYPALSRTLRRALTRERLYSNNTESLGKAFLSRDSILLWVLSTFRARRRRYQALVRSGEFPSIRYCVIRRPREAAELLSQCCPETSVLDAGASRGYPTCMPRGVASEEERAYFERVAASNRANHPEPAPNSLTEVFRRLADIRRTAGALAEPGLPREDKSELAAHLRLYDKYRELRAREREST